MEPEIILGKDYARLKVQDRIISSAALDALAVLGEPSVRTVVYHMSSLAGIREEELLANHSEFEKATGMILGRAADIILKRFSDGLARNVQDKKDPSFSEILAEIRRDERRAFVRNMSYGEQVLLLYRSLEFRDALMAAFFDPVSDAKEARVAVTAAGGSGNNNGGGERSQLPFLVASTTYEQLQANDDGLQDVAEKAGAWASSLCQDGKRLRFAGDNTWLAQKGLDEPPHDKGLLRDAAVMCAYNLESIGARQAAKIVERHRFVVLEDSSAVYTKM